MKKNFYNLKSNYILRTYDYLFFLNSTTTKEIFKFNIVTKEMNELVFSKDLRFDIVHGFIHRGNIFFYDENMVFYNEKGIFFSKWPEVFIFRRHDGRKPSLIISYDKS